MNFHVSDLQVLSPELLLITSVCFCTLLAAKRSEKSHTHVYLTALVALLGAYVLSLTQFVEHPLVVFSGAYTISPLTLLAKMFIALLGFMALVYSRQYLHVHQLPEHEYYILSLLSMLGMMILVSASNLLLLYLGVELLSLCLYALIAYARDSAQSSEAGMKYFVMGALASGMMVFGISLIYGAMCMVLDPHSIGFNYASLQKLVYLLGPGTGAVLYWRVGLVFVLVGLAFKLSVFSFHMWAPDVYQGGPTSVTAFLSSAPKVAAFCALLQFLMNTIATVHFDWQKMVLVMGLGSIVLGNIAAIAQTNVKRLLAYSSIAQMGFVFLGLAVGHQEGFSAALFYVCTYALTALAGFGVLVFLSQRGYEIETLDDLKGLNEREPWSAFLFLIVVFSMAGIPPTAGFIAKFTILRELVLSQHYCIAGFVMLMAVVGAFYYLRLIRKMYFEAPERQPRDFILGSDTRVVLSVNALAVLAFGLMPAVLLRICSMAVH